MQTDDQIFADSVGIDLGTTQCCISVYNYREQRPVEIHNLHGKTLTPSVMVFMRNNRYEADLIEVIGEEATRCNHLPENIVYEVKRLIGRRYNDASVVLDKQLLPYKIIDKRGAPKIKVFDREYAPEDISAKILAELKNYADQYTGKNIQGAVVTVPAHFNNEQRKLTKLAVQRAGFKDVRLMNEPTAAIVQHSRFLQEPKTVLVYDFGGGTFDVTLARADRNQVRVLAKDGDAHLGGADLDNVLMKYVAEKFRAERGIDIMHGRTILRLKRACEEAKMALSHLTNAVILVEAVFEDLDIREEVTREQFENLCSSFFDLTLACVRKTLQSAGIKANDVDEVLIVGGSSNIPKITSLLENEFGKRKLVQSRRPAHAISLGAAIQAAKWIDLDPKFEDFSVTDVVPLSIGTQELGGLFVPMIPRGTVYPFSHSEDIVTSMDGQKNILIEIYEGERRQAKFNNLLGLVKLDGLPPVPAGKQSVHVTFLIDENGILKVKARNEFTQEVEKTITTDMLAYSQNEVNDFVEIAKRNRHDDEIFVKWQAALKKFYHFSIDLRANIKKYTQNEEEKLRKISLIEKYNEWITTFPKVGAQEFQNEFEKLQTNIEIISMQY